MKVVVIKKDESLIRVDHFVIAARWQQQQHPGHPAIVTLPIAKGPSFIAASTVVDGKKS